MPIWGWALVLGVTYLYGRARRQLATGAAGPPAFGGLTLAGAASDVGAGALGVFGEVTDALGAPLRESLYQADRSGEANGPRVTLGR